jgi:hypothetical protein
MSDMPESPLFVLAEKMSSGTAVSGELQITYANTLLRRAAEQ